MSDIIKKNSEHAPKMPWDNNSYKEHEKIIEGCKTCSASCRADAEAMFDQTGSYTRVHKYLNTKGVDVSYAAVRNHMLHHYSATNELTLIKEFAEDLPEWENIQHNQLAGLKRALAILEKEMINIQAYAVGLKGAERYKNAETVDKLAKTMLAYRSKIVEQEKKEEPARVILNQLQIILQEEMTDDTIIVSAGDNPKRLIKNVAMNVLEKLNERCSDYMIEVKD